MLVSSPTASILIDNGLSFRQLKLRAEALGESLEGLRAVFVTHEHSDHVRGLGVLARKLGVPVYITPETFERLPASVGKIPKTQFFESGDALSIDGLTLQSYRVSHDAADPVNYILRCGDCQLGMASDLGQVSNLVRERLHRSHALVLESNYCPTMLQQGPYPPAVRQRIHGSHGHLSNGDMNSLLAGLLHDELQLVVIVHISQENNTEELARSMASKVLGDHPAELVVARQDGPTPMFSLTP